MSMVGYLTLWLVAGGGCMAIWAVTIPTPQLSHRVVVVLAPIVEVRQDLGNQAQEEDEDVDGMFTSVH